MKHTPLPPRTHPIPRSALKRRPRSKKETVRIYGTPAHREWMKRQPCIVCGRTPSDAAHVVTGGTGRKADASECAPLCSDYPDQGCLALGCHSQFDAAKKSFPARHGLDMRAQAAHWWARWVEQGGEA